MSPRSARRSVLAVAVISTLGSVVSKAHATPITGTALLDMCVKHEARASYYILGAIDAFSVRVGQRKRFCMPKGSEIPSVHLANTVCGFVSRHPEQQERDASVLVYRALRDAYPCGVRR